MTQQSKQQCRGASDLFLAARPFKEETTHGATLLRCFYFWDQIRVTAAEKVDSGLEEESAGETEVQPSPWVLWGLNSGSDQKDWSLHCPKGDLDSRWRAALEG